MPSRINWLAILLCACAAATPNYTFLVGLEDPGAWPAILSSAGLQPAAGRPSNVFVLGDAQTGAAEAWLRKIDQGAIVVLQGQSDLAVLLGFHAVSYTHLTLPTILRV